MNWSDYALLAQEAYTDTPDIGVESSASRAIVRETPAGLVVAFPGTNNAASLLADIDAIELSVNGIGRVHRGFWQAWLAIAAPVLDAIDNQPVTLVGHSLGAALAIMAGSAMMAAGKPPLAIYGFEPPRVSPDSSISTLLAAVPTFLTKNGNDAVPDVPVLWQHAADLCQIGKACYPFPNIADHAIARVIATLTGQ